MKFLNWLYTKWGSLQENHNPEALKEFTAQINNQSNQQDEGKIFPIVAIGASAGGLEALQKLEHSLKRYCLKIFSLIISRWIIHSRLSDTVRCSLTVGGSCRKEWAQK